MNKTIAFSIICPAYNCEQSISFSIASIIHQSFNDWELIILDDGSTDNTIKICEEFASKDERIIVIHQENRGQSKARLNGIRSASGEYVLFLDSDDEFVPNALDTIYNSLTSKRCKLLIYNAFVVQRDGKETVIYNFDAMKANEPIEDFFIKRRISYLWSICFQRRLFDLPNDVLDRFCSLSYSEDLYLIYHIVKDLHAEDYEIIDQRLYRYNYNEASLTKNQNAKKALDRFYAFDGVYKSIFFTDKGLFPLMPKEIISTAGWTYLSASRKIALEYDYETYLPLIKQIRSSFLFKHMNHFKKDKYNYIGYILIKLKMYKCFKKYIIKKEGKAK